MYELFGPFLVQSSKTKSFTFPSIRRSYSVRTCERVTNGQDQLA